MRRRGCRERIGEAVRGGEAGKGGQGGRGGERPRAEGEEGREAGAAERGGTAARRDGLRRAKEAEEMGTVNLASTCERRDAEAWRPGVEGEREWGREAPCARGGKAPRFLVLVEHRFPRLQGKSEMRVFAPPRMRPTNVSLHRTFHFKEFFPNL